MHHTRDPRQPNRSQCHEPATAEKRGALLSLSWYSSVPRQRLTLRYPGFQRHGPRAVQAFGRGSWVASRRQTAGPRSAWRSATGNDSVVRVTGVEMSPRRNWSECGLQSGTSFQDQGGWALVAQGGPQDAHRATGGGDPSDAVRFRLFELVCNRCARRVGARSEWPAHSTGPGADTHRRP